MRDAVRAIARPGGEWTTEFCIDPASGRYVARHVPASPPVHVQANSVDNCAWGETCDTDDGASFVTSNVITVTQQDDHSQTWLSLGVTARHGDLDGFERVDRADQGCYA
ncbi:MAG TPA: hypothetical protein VFN10_02190 [Thermoanaerobaculia bacterium]|nr:hypothetical protein [Thermoanaerobaculia bacterium]